MSSLIVQVCTVDDVLPHPNADRMEIAVVKGWRTCIGKGQFKKGQACVYIPPDSTLPGELAEKMGVSKYLQPLPKNADSTRPPGGRIRVARLRGEQSYGLLMPVENPTSSRKAKRSRSPRSCTARTRVWVSSASRMNRARRGSRSWSEAMTFAARNLSP